MSTPLSSDLGQSDSPEALGALLEVAADHNEDDLISASSGESIAEIWLRTGAFDAQALASIHGAARDEVLSRLTSERPEWLTSSEPPLMRGGD